jgi:hypothetical protein
MDDLKATGKSITAQRTYLIDKHRFNYEGIFIVQDLYKLIDEYFEEKGYDKCEIKNAEIVRDDGVRYIELVFEPWKKITDYAKVQIWLRVIIEDIKEVEIEKEGIKVNAHQGKVMFTFDVVVDTDYEDKWGTKTIFAVFRIFFDKYFLKKYTQQYYAEAIDDYKMLVYQIKTYLNMHKG